MADYKFTRATDAQIVNLFDRLLSFGNGATGNFYLGGDLTLPIGQKAELPISGWNLIGVNSYSINAAQIVFSNNGANGGLRYIRDGVAPFVDGMEFSGQFSSFTEEFKVLVISEISRFLDMAPPVALQEQGSSALGQTQTILNQVSSAVLALTAHSAERVKALDAAIDAERARLEAEFRVEKAKLHALHDEERSDLERMREDLDERANGFDDRSNTDARRKIYDEMVKLPEAITNKGLLKNSEKESYSITIISVVLGVILATLAWRASESFEGLKDQSVVIFLEVTRVLLGLGAGALIWFGISNLAARNRRVAEWEQELNRFRLDVERASFLIEGDLEARKINQTGLPDVMLEAFSRGLFSNEKADHGSDQVGNVLAHLFSNSAKFKVGSNGVEAELNGKGIKKAEKEVG